MPGEALSPQSEIRALAPGAELERLLAHRPQKALALHAGRRDPEQAPVALLHARQEDRVALGVTPAVQLVGDGEGEDQAVEPVHISGLHREATARLAVHGLALLQAHALREPR